MKINKNLVYLSIIFLIGFIFRFFLVSTNPPSLNWDEAAFGYNAFSIGIDGRDEFGRFLPIDYIESFGDFKPPMYAYLDVVPVKIFGLNALSVRLPSALVGSLSILATFFLVKELFPKKKNKETLGLLSALFLAISPWHVMLSRGAFEANVAMFFILCGVLFFLRFINGRQWEIILSAVFFTLSIYTFNTARVVAPVIVIILGLIFFRKLLSNKKPVFIAIIVGLIMIAPIFNFLISPQAALRFKEVNIFSDADVVKMANQQIANDNNNPISKVIHNRRVLYAQSYLKHYFDNLNPNFLFIKGDGNPRFSTQDVGQMYIWDLPFVIIGLIMLFRKKEGYYYLVPLIILIGIIPAASARETPHALRIENTLPYFQILTAYGVLYIISRIIKYKKPAILILGTLLILNTLYFVHGLFLHYPREYSSEWQYSYKDSVDYVSQNYQKYDNFSITNVFGRPYIYYLYQNSYDPKKFRRNSDVQRDAFGFVTVKSFDKFHFSPDVSSITSKNTLYIDTRVPKEAKIQKTFYLLNGEKALFAYTL